MRLTDQALVAVTAARGAAGAQRATVVHLLVGLATESDGVAARALRRQDAAVACLFGLAASASPRLPCLETAVGWAADAVSGRPLWTSDLLLAALEVGGADLADLLERCDVDPLDLAVARPDALAPWAVVAQGADALTETFGHDPRDTTATPPAARAIARARALGGSAVALLVALAVEQPLARDAIPLDPDELAQRLYDERHSSAATLVRARPDEADHGVDAVLRAAARIRTPDSPVVPLDLLRAAALAGGTRPAALLAPPGSCS